MIGILLVGFGLAHWQHGSDIGLPAGWGGLPALLLDHGYSALIDRAGDNWSKLLRWIAIAASMVGGMMLITRSLELSRPLFSIPTISLPSRASADGLALADANAIDVRREPEFVADPVPRKPGAEFVQPPEPTEISPFAVLRGLKGPDSSEQG